MTDKAQKPTDEKTNKLKDNSKTAGFSLSEAMEATEILNDFPILREEAKITAAYISANKEKLAKAARDLSDLIPYLETAIREDKKYQGITIEQLLGQIDAFGEPQTDIAKKIINKAQRLRKADVKTPRQKAIDKNVSMAAGTRLAFASKKGMENALNIPSLRIISGKIPGGAFDENGQLNELIAGKPETMETLPGRGLSFPAVLLDAALECADYTNGLISIYLPAFFKRNKIDPRPFADKRLTDDKYIVAKEQGENILRYKAFMTMEEPFDNIAGYDPASNRFLQVCSFHSYDLDSETITLSAPYIYAVARELTNQQENKSHPLPINRLIYGSAITTRNQLAIEVASRILDGVLQRGLEPNKKKNTGRIEYQISFQAFINTCPQLLLALEKTKNGKNPAQAYNEKLKRTFEAAYKVIMEKSDAPKIYLNFTIEPKNPKTGKLQPPTKTTLGSNLTISHEGKIENSSLF